MRSTAEISNQIQHIKKMKKESKESGNPIRESYWRGRLEMVDWFVNDQQDLKGFCK